MYVYVWGKEGVLNTQMRCLKVFSDTTNKEKREEGERKVIKSVSVDNVMSSHKNFGRGTGRLCFGLID